MRMQIFQITASAFAFSPILIMINSITAKVEYAKEKALLGYYAWQVADNRNGTLAQAG
jgi:hypothetical protein